MRSGEEIYINLDTTGTLLPAPVYMCTFLSSFGLVNWLLPKLLQKVHIYTGAGSKVISLPMESDYMIGVVLLVITILSRS